MIVSVREINHNEFISKVEPVSIQPTSEEMEIFINKFKKEYSNLSTYNELTCEPIDLPKYYEIHIHKEKTNETNLQH